mgnify:CR=1 FL=1
MTLLLFVYRALLAFDYTAIVNATDITYYSVVQIFISSPSSNFIVEANEQGRYQVTRKLRSMQSLLFRVMC